jgi:hypothetical protein
MAVFIGEAGGEEVALYVWRFRGLEGQWLAAVSGPYPTAIVGPMAGSSTFSRFEPWEAKSAAQHAAAVLQTLESWSSD